MTKTERRKWLFEQILRLRRAERQAPQLREIVIVRVELENELGAGLSPSMAASILGVTHTALFRWIRLGEVPAVTKPSGRKLVPPAALVDLYESVEEHRRPGQSPRWRR